MIHHRRSAAALVLGAVAVGVFGLAAPAAAHVTVNPGEATQGGYARLAFRVPNESDTASTTKVEVVLPENAPVASVSTMPVPGWTVATEKRKLSTPLEVHGSQISEAVSKITWTATGGAAVKPGQFQEFPVSMGPLPEVDQMVFKSLQTYSDGNVVRWIEEPPANAGEEPEHPAPVLKLVAAAASATPSAAPATVPVSQADEDNNGPALAFGIAGLIAGLAGLALGAAAFARARRPTPPAA
jgi:periplasmic copper chaperone A